MKHLHALKKNVSEYCFTAKQKDGDIIHFFQRIKPKLKDIIKKYLVKHPVKITLAIQIKLKKMTFDNKERIIRPWFNTNRAYEVFQSSKLNTVLSKIIQQLNENFEIFLKIGSGFVLEKIKSLRLKLAHYDPVWGSLKIAPELPVWVLSKHACIAKIHATEMTNNTNWCFCYAVIKSIYGAFVNPSKYIYKLDLRGITLPMRINNISRFEKRNHLRINVYSINDKDNKVTLLHMSDSEAPRTINLLLYKYHYYAITNLSRLLSNQISPTGHKRYYCDKCLYSTRSKLVLSKHVCTRNGNQCFLYPNWGECIKFQDLHKCTRQDFCIYYDFESVAAPIHRGKRGQNSIDKFKHHPISYGVIRKNAYCSCYDTDIRIYRGPDAVSNFVSYLNEMEKEFDSISKLNYKIKWSPLTKAKHKLARRCDICKVSFVGEKKTAHHIHYCNTKKCGSDSNVVASLCNRCNLTIAIMRKTVPVLAHNSGKYDNHFIVRCLSQFKSKDIHIIPRTNETYLSVRIGRYQFLDTFEFLHFSLEHLAEVLLKKDTSAFHLLNVKFPDKCQRDLLTKKCVFPYKVAESEEILNTTYSLPERNQFYNILTKTLVTDEEYTRAKHIWDTFRCKTLGEYYDIYLLIDVILLADIFENFRNTCFKFYAIDPVRCLSIAQLSWQACLKYTNAEIELISDPLMYGMIERMVRGGISNVITKYARANNPHLDTFDIDQPVNYINYLDCNGLYSHVMCDSLPIGGYRWVKDPHLFDIKNVSTSGNTGYILEVDLNYPVHLHNLHNQFPLAPEHRAIPYEDLSPMNQYIHNKCGMKYDSKQIKLLLTLYPKEKYILDYRLLLKYLELGMELLRVHRVLQYKQSPWMKKFIMFNTHKRQQVESDFEKDIFKLMNNSLFGKSLQNVRKQRNYTLTTKVDKLRKLINTAHYTDFDIISRNLVGVSLKKQHILLNKPIILGAVILDLSKLVMYKFHYQVVLKAYSPFAVKILCMDTDGILYSFRDKDPRHLVHKFPQWFDTSNFDINHPCYDPTQAQELGRFKFVYSKKEILEYVGLKPKLYSIQFNNDDGKKLAKGVPRRSMNLIMHEDYLMTLVNHSELHHSFYNFKSRLHKITTQLQRKVAMSPFDSKRYALPNMVNTLAYGFDGIT